METQNASTTKSTKTHPMGAETGFQERLMKQINELGEALERAGDSISGKGWETIGNAIHRLGDTLEHLRIDSEKHVSVDKSSPGVKATKEAKAHEMMAEESSQDEVLGKSAAKPSTDDRKSYTGASRAEPFATGYSDTPYTGVPDPAASKSQSADSLQSKSTKPQASDSQAY